jgi:hypothetical protein
MKNLPEHETFKTLESRLSNYTEQPDDDLWQKIAAGLPPRKPVWAPWMNRFAGILTLAALGWATWDRPTQKVEENTAVIAQPKSAAVGEITSDDMATSQIQKGYEGPKDVSSSGSQQERMADTTPVNKESTRTNRSSESTTAGAGLVLDSHVNAAGTTNQRAGSTRVASKALHSFAGAQSTASRVSDSSPAAAIPTMGARSHSSLGPDQRASSSALKSFGAVIDSSASASFPKQKSAVTSLSSSNRDAIKPADEFKPATTSSTHGSTKTQSTQESTTTLSTQASATTLSTQESIKTPSTQESTTILSTQESASTMSTQESTTALSTQGSATTLSTTHESTKTSSTQQIAGGSSQQEGVLIKLPDADSAATAGQRVVPYNRPEKKRKDISFYALFSPTLSFQTATPSARDGVVVQKFNKPSMLSGDRLGLALEAGVQGRLSKKFEYFAGLSVYHQSQTLRYTYQNAGDVVIENGADGLSYTVKPATAERSVSYHMLNLGAQAGVFYTLKEHRISHKIGMGLQYQRGLMHAATGEPYDNASSGYLNYQILYRAEMAFHDRLTFIVQPSLTRTWLVNETLQLPFTLKQYRPGVSIGLSYRLRR